MLRPEIITRSEMILVAIVRTGQSVSDIDMAGLWEQFIANEPGIPHNMDSETGYELRTEKE